jgi:hypothetical protein
MSATGIVTKSQPSVGIDSAKSPKQILQLTLTALSEGRVSEAVSHFYPGFIFNDRALDLEFTDQARLSEFFNKSRELFPDTTLDILSMFEDGDHAIAEWKLLATQIVPCWGSISCHFPIELRGSTIARVENGKIVEWSDYYDQGSSRRVGLAAVFTEWIEY